MRLAETGGEPISLGAFREHIVDQCAEGIAMLARHRAELPVKNVSKSEARIRRYRDAILALEGDSVRYVAAWWERSQESSDPWKAWAAAFVFGSFCTEDAKQAVIHAIELLPQDDEEHWMAAAEALALIESPHAVSLGRDLVSSSSPVAQAAGLDLLSRRQALHVEALARHLAATDPPVLIAAIRAVERADAVGRLTPWLSTCLRSSCAAVAWEAARVLTRAGRMEPYLEIQAGGPLARVLGVRAVELLIMVGDASDLGTFEALLERTPMSRSLLSAVARFGHVTTWSFLLHYLADPELAEAAVLALQTLFGMLVPAHEAKCSQAWRDAIIEAGFDPSIRYRGGKPWRPATVLSECISAELPRAEVEQRVDELAARTGTQGLVDLCLWEPEARRSVAAFGDEVGARDAEWRPGAWR